MKRIAAILALVLSVMLLAGCAQKPVPTVTAPELLNPQLVVPELRTAYVSDFYLSGIRTAYVEPYTQTLYFSVSGTVAEVYVYPGMLVEEGDLLAVLDHSSLTRRIEALDEELAYAEATNAYSDKMAQLEIDILNVELRQLQAQLAELEQPTQEEAAAPDVEAIARKENEIALKKNEIAQAEADLRQEQAQREAALKPKTDELAQIREEMEQYYLRAPFSGRIAYDVGLVVGQIIKSSTPALTLSDDSQLVLHSVGIISDTVAEIADSMYVRLGDTDYTIKRIPPTDQEALLAIQNETQPECRFEILGTEEELAKLEIGQYGIIFLTWYYTEDALLIPSEAVFIESSVSYVYVDVDGSRVRREVETGIDNGTLVQIISGLEEGDEVYVS